MKKIYSILTLAALLTAGEAFAQTKGVSGNEVTFEGPWTIEAINYELADVVYGTVDVSKVEGIDGETVVTASPNTVIVAKDKDQLANTTNVLVYVPIRDLGTGETKTFAYMEKFVLTDGYDWLCEREFDAGHAYYERECKNTYNTLCLPFCFYVNELMNERDDIHLEILQKIDDENTLWFDRISEENVKEGVKTGPRGVHVPARTPMIAHLHPTPAGDINYKLVIEPKGAVSVNNVNEEPAFDKIVYTLEGQLQSTVINDESDKKGAYYIQDNYFWKYEDYVNEDGSFAEVEVPAFRCLLTDFHPTNEEFVVPTEAKSLKIATVGEATSINTVATTTLETPAYNLQGVRVAPTAKGFVLKNGKKYFNK